MDICRVIRMDNSELLRRLTRLEENADFLAHDLVSDFKRLKWDIFSSEEAKQKVLYSKLEKGGKFAETLKEMTHKTELLRSILDQLDDVGPVDRMWPNWFELALNVMRDKNRGEEQFLKKISGAFNTVERARLVTEYERVRESYPEISEFQFHDAPHARQLRQG